jgi:hypothetical protein
MPLKAGSDPEAISENIATEIRHDRPPAQAEAIAYRKARETDPSIPGPKHRKPCEVPHMSKTSTASRTRNLFAFPGDQEELEFSAGRVAKQEEEERIFRTGAEIKRLRLAMEAEKTEFEARDELSRQHLAKLEPLTQRYNLPLSRAKDKKAEEKRLLRVRSEFRRLTEARNHAAKDFGARFAVSEKRIAELEESLTKGAHAIGSALEVFGGEVDAKHRK